jgi:predicted MPP superfamily phosphohydrolase
VIFTGDLVNNFSGELIGWDTVFLKIQARDKYAVLGNHDYGDYSSWDSEELKQKNFDEIKEFYARINFRLLNNENEIFRIGNDSIAIIGVENWGTPPFSQYGDLQKALSGVESVSFKILLSHDPSQWDEEVSGHTDIAITFSGHTHGMQFGIETSWIKWSPIQMKYPRWGGLYREENQYLYVNRGLGYVGFPGRIGMPPEITVITLVKANKPK